MLGIIVSISALNINERDKIYANLKKKIIYQTDWDSLQEGESYSVTKMFHQNCGILV